MQTKFSALFIKIYYITKIRTNFAKAAFTPWRITQQKMFLEYQKHTYLLCGQLVNELRVQNKNNPTDY